MAIDGGVVDADGGDGGMVIANCPTVSPQGQSSVRPVGIQLTCRTVEGSIKRVDDSTLCVLIVCSWQEGLLREACRRIPNSHRPRLPSLLSSTAEPSTNLVLRNRLVIGTVGGASHCDVKRLTCVVRDKI